MCFRRYKINKVQTITTKQKRLVMLIYSLGQHSAFNEMHPTVSCEMFMYAQKKHACVSYYNNSIA